MDPGSPSRSPLTNRDQLYAVKESLSLLRGSAVLPRAASPQPSPVHSPCVHIRATGSLKASRGTIGIPSLSELRPLSPLIPNPLNPDLEGRLKECLDHSCSLLSQKEGRLTEGELASAQALLKALNKKLNIQQPPKYEKYESHANMASPDKLVMQNSFSIESSPNGSPSTSPRKRKQQAITTAMVCKRLLFTGQLRNKAIHDMLLALIIELASIPQDTSQYKYSYIKSRTSQLVGSEDCSIWVVEDADHALVEMGGNNSFDLNECPMRAVRYVARTGECINYRRSTASDLEIDIDEKRDPSVKSLLVVPILRDSDPIGALQVMNKRGGPGFAEWDTQLLEAVAMITSLLIRCGVLDGKAKRQELRAKALLKVGTLISSADFDNDNLVYTVMESAKGLIKSQGCSLFIVDEEGLLAGPPGKDIANHVLIEGKPLNIADIREHFLYQRCKDELSSDTRSVLCCPVRYENCIVAIAQLTNKRHRGKIVSYTDDDVELFNSFSVFVAVSLRNLKQHRTLKQALARNQAIMASVRRLAITDMRDSEDVVQNIIQGAKEMVNSDKCHLFLVDKEKNELFGITDGVHDEELEAERLAIGEGIIGAVAQSGKPENIKNVNLDPRYNRTADTKIGYETLSLLCCPVHHDDEVVAVIQLKNKLNENYEVDVFSKEDEMLFSDFAEFVGVSLYNNKIYQFAVSARDNAMMLLQAQGTNTAGSNKNFTPCSDKDVELYRDLTLTQGEKEDCLRHDFNIHDLRASNPDKVILVLMELFRDLGVVEELNIEEERLLHFLIVVRLNYRMVHYHNFFHAADTCQTVYCYLKHNDMYRRLKPVECFVLMITALVHDVDHMGLNNSFHYKTETPMGILSTSTGSSSILEVHHCNKAIDILATQEFDVFANLNADDQKLAYKIMINCILATDMARHKELHDALRGMGVFDIENDDHRMTLMQILLKSADISNITKPFAISKKWAVAVTEEFYCQGDKERELGETVLPMFDRDKERALAEGQIGFINGIGLAHFNAVSKVFPSMQPLTMVINDNYKRWNQQLKEFNCISGSAVKSARRLSVVPDGMGSMGGRRLSLTGEELKNKLYSP